MSKLDEAALEAAVDAHLKWEGWARNATQDFGDQQRDILRQQTEAAIIEYLSHTSLRTEPVAWLEYGGNRRFIRFTDPGNDIGWRPLYVSPPAPTAREEALEEAAAELDSVAEWAERTSEQVIEDWVKPSDIPRDDKAENRKYAEERRQMGRTYRAAAGRIRALKGAAK